MSSLVSLSLTLRVLVSLLLTSFEHISILHDLKYAKTQAFYWQKGRKVNRLKIEMFFHGTTDLQARNIGPSNLTFARLCVQGALTRFYGVKIDRQIDR